MKTKSFFKMRPAVLDARPHPGPLPQGEGESFPAYLKIRAAGSGGRTSEKSAAGDGCPLSPGERARVRASVHQTIPLGFTVYVFILLFCFFSPPVFAQSDGSG